MKKIMAAMLCTVLCLCLTLPAFAAGTVEGDYPGQNQGADVNITISGNVVHVYLVDIEFTAPTFTYSSDGYKWNPDEYKYEHGDDTTWSGNGTVKIINHSDLSVKYTVEKANVVTDYGPLDIVLTGATSGTIDACTVNTVIGSKNAAVTYTVSGTPTVASVTAKKLGEIKVTISK